MGVIVKQGIKGIAFSYVGVLLGYINWIFLFPLFLSKAEMGFVRIIMDVSLLLSAIFGFGIPQAIIKFYPYGNQKFSRSFFATFGLISLIAALIFIPLFFLLQSPFQSFFAERAALLNSYMWVLLPAVLFLISYDFFEAMNRIRLNISGAIFIKEIFFRALTMLAIIGFGLKLYSFNVLVLAIIASYALQALAMGLAFLHKWQPDESPLIPSKPTGDQIRYMVLLFMGTGGTMVVNQIDSVMIGGKKGLDYAAVYALAYFMTSVLHIPFRAINSISSGIVSSFFATGNMDGLRKLYKTSSSNLYLLGGFLFLGIWLNIDLLFSFIPEDQASTLRFSDGKWVFFILGFARIFDMLMGINGMILVNSKYYLANMITMPLLAALTIVCNILLIPILGMEGAAVAALISIVIFNIIRYFIIYIKLDMQPLSWNSAVITLLFTGAVGLSFVVSFDDYLTQLVYSITSIGLFYCIPSYFLKLSPEINQAITDTWKKFIKR